MDDYFSPEFLEVHEYLLELLVLGMVWPKGPGDDDYIDFYYACFLLGFVDGV